MPDNRLPKKVLYGQLSEGTRLPQGPKKRYKDQLKQSLRNFNVNPDKFEEDTLDRTKWRSTCFEGLRHFEATRATEREVRRQQRHASRQVPPPEDGPQFQCPECGRVCRSRIGLFSHRRTHGAETSGRDGSHVIIVSDGLQ